MFEKNCRRQFTKTADYTILAVEITATGAVGSAGKFLLLLRAVARDMVRGKNHPVSYLRKTCNFSPLPLVFLL